MHHIVRTAESVSPHHPDKLCDRISDAILDEYLRQDPGARVAVEAMGAHGKVYVAGEVSSHATVEIVPIVRRIAGEVEVEVRIASQSHEIAAGIQAGGAGDQGIMVGYATKETPELLPLETVLARSLNQFLYRTWPYDGKTQITLHGAEIVAIVASFQYATHRDLETQVRQWLRQYAPQYVSTSTQKDTDPTLHINPAGDWKIGGFSADAGLTGRKLVVDNYGPRIAIGGGCYSGKDPSKVDRSAAYMARKIAVEYLKRYRAETVHTYLAYAIGHDAPVQATAIVDGTPRRITGYDLSPEGIISQLDLRRPIYEKTAEYGHFGHQQFAWE